MAQLIHQLRNITCPDGNPAVVVSLNGSIDPASIDDFDSIFDELLAQGTKRIIMDLEKLKYINSTGMGIMVQYCDQLVDEGGGLVLMCVQSKVIITLQLLGLQEFFPIVATEEEAVAALMGESVAPANVQVQLSESDVPQQISANDIFSCGNCAADLIIPCAGDYLCPRCHSLVSVDSSGNFATHAISEASNSLELCIPSEMPYYKSAAALVARIGLKAGLDDVAARAVADSFLNALKSLCDSCYGNAGTGNSQGKINLFACAVNGVFRVHIYVGGNKIPDETIFAPCKSGFDEYRYEPINGGNLLTLSKSVS